jgi:hypothetical protein
MTMEGMTDAERKALQRLRTRLQATGVDVDAKAALLRDLVLADNRIRRLRAAEIRAAKAGDSGSATRSLNVALAERRRLHQAIHGRPLATTATEKKLSPLRALWAAEDAPLEPAVQAWREFWAASGYRSGSLMRPVVSGPAADAVRARWGDPPMRALLYPTDEAQAEAYDTIERNMPWSRG